MAGLFLLLLSLGWMVFRVAPARRATVEGKPLLTVPLTYRERLAFQRVNLVCLGLILLLGAIGKWFSLPFELLAIMAAYGILLLPVRYQITSQGIALNRVVFRRWNDFATVEGTARQIMLAGRPGSSRFIVRLPAARQTEILPLIRRFVPRFEPRPAAAPMKGGKGTQDSPRARKGEGPSWRRARHLLPKRP
ncbi:MAG: hypothetical protein ACR2PL_20800 [Dehalococcoidia bacterium]